MTLVKGQTLQAGKYIIERVLMEGPFGITCQATHSHLSHTVVIKTPAETGLQNFQQEVAISAEISKLRHPNIVRIYDYFVENERPYLVMEFVPGESLEDLINRLKKENRLFPEREAIACIRQIGEALVALHVAGFVHRDVKPGNIIRQQNGMAILIDFGIAMPISPSDSVTENVTTTIVEENSSRQPQTINEARTKAFSPYEQGREGDGKPTVDIYSLAATLYFALSGEPPVEAADRKHFKIEQRKIESISDRLNSAILTGMALEPSERPQSVRDWLSILPNEPSVSNQKKITDEKTEFFLAETTTA